MNEDKLMTALENEKNEQILNTTFSKIKTEKNDILQRLQLSREKLKLFHNKLKNYKYCETTDDIEFGHYIRWISLKTPDNIKLTNGGIIIDMKIQNDNLYIVCKNNMNRIFQLNFNSNFNFSKNISTRRYYFTCIRIFK